MDLFFDPEFDPDQSLLSAEESHHCVRVLRHGPGDEIKITNGKGTVWEGTISSIEAGRCRIETDLEIETKSPVIRRSIAICPTKGSDRFEWFVEKATELGVSEIYPVICQFSERRTINQERVRKKMVSALKQSQNPFLPVVHPIQTFKSFVSGIYDYPNKFLGNISDHMKPPEIQDTEDALFLIGPEGGFSEDEIKLATEKGFQEVLLGKYILRTETAGIVAIQYLYLNI